MSSSGSEPLASTVTGMKRRGRGIIPAPRGRCARVGAALAVFLVAGGGAGAVTGVVAGADEPSIERPSASNRLVRLFDFEEADYNPLPVPFGWIRAQDDPAVPRVREGFPIWNQGGLDTASPAVSGVGTARLEVSGGSASLRLLSGVVGVFPGADYGVSARVRTEGLVHARAAIAARLLDQQGRIIPGTEVISELVRTDGGWATVSIAVPGIDERAASLQIEMLALQPRQQPGRRSEADRRFKVWNEDYDGKVWFDDLAVRLLPRLEMDTGQPGHVITADQTPRLDVLVRDLTGEQLTATVRVMDADARPVDEMEMRPGQGRLVERFEPALPGPGWYRAVLTVRSSDEVVATSRLDFAVGAAADADAVRHPSFAIRAGAVDASDAAALPTVVAWSGVGRAVVGVWNESLDRESAGPDTNPAFGAVRTLLDRGVEVTVSLDEAPGDLSALIGLDPWDVPGLIGSDESLWMPWSERMLDLFGQGVLTWQLGRHAWDNDAERLAGRLGGAAASIARWVPGPQVTAPWPMGYAITPELVRPGRGLVLRDDGAGSDGDLDDLVSAWAGRALAVTGGARGPTEDAPGLTIEFEASTDGRVSRAALGKLARRVITAWAAAERSGVGERVVFALSEPWSATGGLRPARMPTPELAAWRTLSSVLGSPGVDGLVEIDLLPGVRTLLSGSGDEGVLIAWLDDPEAPVRTLELPLNIGPVRRVDLLGSRRDIRPEEDREMGLSTHRIALSREPVIIEGVRAELVRFLSSVRFSPERLNPVLGEREHRLVIDNPWPFPVRGRVFIVEPGGLSSGTGGRDRSWEITPRVLAFSIDAGQSWSAPVGIAFGASQETGWTEAVFDVQLSADEEYALLRVPRRIEIASEDLELTAVAYRATGAEAGAGGAGAVSVHVIVTNRSDEPQSVELAAVAVGAARERATVNGLEKGQSVERRFLLFGLAPGARISVGLTEPSTGTRLTRTIETP